MSPQRGLGAEQSTGLGQKNQNLLGKKGGKLGFGGSWESGRCPCPWWGVELDEIEGPCKVPASLSHKLWG